MIDQLSSFLETLSISPSLAAMLATVIVWCGVIGVALLVHFIVKHLIAGNIKKLVAKTGSKRDDMLVKSGAFERLARLVPAYIVYRAAPIVFGHYPAIGQVFVVLALIAMVVITVLFLDALINSALSIYQTYEVSRQIPINSFTQIAKLVVYLVGFIMILSIVMGESPLTFFAGIGALAAVFMFVFKDPILGFVAGIQLTANKMLSVGDWIEMPKYGVDGDILEIALTTVKIRNFDKTITTIPTNSLITDSFKNWRGMQDTGARRIKRSVSIDMSTIKFCDEEMLSRFSKIQFITDYIKTKTKEVGAFNEKAGIDESVQVNGRRLTNVGTFRAYIQAYLRNHPQISQDHTFLVRQLAPGETGLPIEIYVFSSQTNWVLYEGIIADIFDHILAAAGEFDLAIFQNPVGRDFANLKG